jgi:hypothetical protein
MNFVVRKKQGLLDIIETGYPGARKDKRQMVSPEEY